MNREYKLFIKDILEALNDILEFVEGMQLDSFLDDKKTKRAVVQAIEVIGEASKNIPDAIISRYNDVPWKEMAKMRDKIAHFYFGIDYKIVWKVVKNRLPEIKPKIEQILKDLETENING